MSFPSGLDIRITQDLACETLDAPDETRSDGWVSRVWVWARVWVWMGIWIGWVCEWVWVRVRWIWIWIWIWVRTRRVYGARSRSDSHIYRGRGRLQHVGVFVRVAFVPAACPRYVCPGAGVGVELGAGLGLGLRGGSADPG